jgi:hypothetical protein
VSNLVWRGLLLSALLDCWLDERTRQLRYVRHIRLLFRLVFLLWFWNLLGELFYPILLSVRNITGFFCDGVVAVFTGLLLVFEIILVLDSLSYLLLRLSALIGNCPLVAAHV